MHHASSRALHAGGAVCLAVADDNRVVNERLAARCFHFFLQDISQYIELMVARQRVAVRRSNGDVRLAPVFVAPIAARAQIRAGASHLGPSVALGVADKLVALVFEGGEGRGVDTGVDGGGAGGGAREGGGGGLGGGG